MHTRASHPRVPACSFTASATRTWQVFEAAHGGAAGGGKPAPTTTTTKAQMSGAAMDAQCSGMAPAAHVVVCTLKMTSSKARDLPRVVGALAKVAAACGGVLVTRTRTLSANEQTGQARASGRALCGVESLASSPQKRTKCVRGQVDPPRGGIALTVTVWTFLHCLCSCRHLACSTLCAFGSV